VTLHPSIAAVRVPVRRTLARPEPRGSGAETVAVACSGGADSLALASATVFEGHKLGMRVVGVTVDHGLQPGSAAQAERVVAQLAEMGVDETLTARVEVDAASGLGPEAAAREARYAVLEQVAEHLGARHVLLGHTLDDQAETVLLGLTRGSGGRSLQGMRPAFGVFARPLLGVRRADTVTACLVEGLAVWDDPHNADPGYTRVRVRERVLPVLEAELGPGIAEALVRTADQLREDEAAFAEQIDEFIEEICEPAEAGIAVSAAVLAANPAALRQRIIRHVVASEFGVALTRRQTLAVARLVTDWHGQGPIDLPGCRAGRVGGRIEFTAR
jgi:tRNA(Ile)-lysidine synthase